MGKSHALQQLTAWWRGSDHKAVRRRQRYSVLRPEPLEDRRLLAVLTIAQENQLPGTAPSVWDVGTGSGNIQGYATQMSVNHGETEQFKVYTDSNNYRVDIYRMGYYGGLGARFITTVNPSVSLPQNQPAGVEDPSTGLIDAGNWHVSAQWTVPDDATSGVYVADLIRQDGTFGKSQIIFIVRNDQSHSNIVFKTADATWEAYNDWGGNDLYGGDGITHSTDGRAYAVSYNRPFDYNLRSYNLVSFFFGEDYPMVRFLERNGFDVSYIATKDLDEQSALLLNHQIFVTAGHDEYWSNAERSAVETARDAGVNLGFFGGNDIFWKTYWAPSSFDATTPDRTLVCYKDTHANAIIDPVNPDIWTGTWRDPRFSPPADGGRPENAVMGTLFMVNSDGTSHPITVPGTDANLRFWRNTSIANLSANQTASLSDHVLGEEWDVDIDNGFRPAGLIDLSSTTLSVGALLQDYGSNYAPGTATHSLTMYRAASGAIVFSAGSQQWSWGLDGTHDGQSCLVDSRMQQAMINLFADMGVQPTTLIAGLVPSTMSTDNIAPTSTITSPLNGAIIQAAVPITIKGTAQDAGGGVIAVVEISVNGGRTWHRVNGTSSWTYHWTPPTSGTVTIKIRAVDDSANIEQPWAGITLNPPTVTAFTPASGALNVATGATPTIKFSKAMNSPTINASTVFLLDASNVPVAATIAYNSATHVVTLTPTNLLANSTIYTIVVKSGSAGVTDLAGNVLVSDATSSFTTTAPFASSFSLWTGSATPAIVNSGDTQAVELGMKFTSDTSGFITGLRFYKSAANTGMHTASLWGAGGKLLATATFVNETASGWQQVTFATPVAIKAGTTYVASYHTNVGHYSVSRSYFTSGFTSGPLHVPVNGGVYLYGSGGFPNNTYKASNYWVDVVLSTSLPVGTTPPMVTAFIPAGGISNVTANATATITFSEALNPATVNASTIFMRDAGNLLVPSAVAYNSSTKTVTLTPTNPLANATTYTIVVKGGSGGVTDLAGNALVSDAISSFTTSAPSSSSPSSLSTGSATPAIVDSGDGQAAELGMKFTSDSNGFITGLRFYKSAANTGTHTASLWGADGKLLATATFANETASGWQQVKFAAPVAIKAGTTYVASYHTNAGHYSVSSSYFTSKFTNGPLHVPANGGVYLYGAGGFPNNTYQASNYWVDVLFVPSGS